MRLATPAEQWHRRTLGLWMFLGTLVMLFAAFTSALVVRASGEDWQSLQLPPVLWLNLAVIGASSVALEAARRVRRAGAKHPKYSKHPPGATHPPREDTSGRLRLALVALSAMLGVVFLAGQVVAWQQLMRRGVYLPSSPYSSFLYLLTGLHGVHVIAALGFLLFLAFRTVTGARADEWPYLARSVATFWHFLAVTWLYLFIVLELA